MQDKRTALCWVCEKRCEGGVFSPFIYDRKDNVRATACNKHATHRWVVVGFSEIKEELING